MDELWTNNTAFRSECTFQSKPNAVVSPNQLAQEGGIIHIFTMAWTLFLTFVLFVCSFLQRHPILSTESLFPRIT